MTKTPKIIVLTPVKNEAWILDRFLTVTSRFADHIIVADQSSSDCSIAICQKYPKVHLIDNKSEQYDEASRQQLLLRIARELVTGPRILLALDADEVLAANALSRPGWQTMLNADPGTVLCFEKPDLYVSPERCMRYDIPWPIGYVDDGVEHIAKKIHSIRIPMPLSAPRLAVHDVKVMHYAWTRWTGQAAKIRLYSVTENVLGITPAAIKRRARYSSNEDYANVGRLESTPTEWFRGWEDIGIDMQTIRSEKYYWQDFEVLKHFAEYGVQRFYADDIWYFDWETCRQFAVSMKLPGISDQPIVGPKPIISVGRKILDSSYDILHKSRRRLISNKSTLDWL